MTKQQYIQEAYGQRWDEIKDLVDENGWVKDDWIAHGLSNGIGYDELKMPYTIEQVNFKSFVGSDSIWRLRSLHNIDTNNGWTKINSRDDLPANPGEYLFIFIDGRSRIEYHSEHISIGGTTHWRPIVQIPNPLY